MPTLEISLKDLEKLSGKGFNTTQELEEALMFAKAELESGSVEEGDELKLDSKDTNRPDLWSTEGVAREIAGRFGKKGCPKYDVAKGSLVVNVDGKSQIKDVRPFTVCAVVKGLEMTNAVILQMIQLQEKISVTFGRNRKEVAIGVYDYNKIKSPITYATFKPNELKFKPLGDDTTSYEEMTLADILEKHPKGKEFAHLLEGEEEYPIFIDANKQVLSMPPIINSDYTGKVTAETKDVFIECSGFELRFLIPALNSLVAALADRGGKVESVQVNYPSDYGSISKTELDMSPKKTEVSLKKMKSLIGIDIPNKEIVDLLEQARYNVTQEGDTLKLEYPCYRQDIMHWRDVFEDVMISYGYNNVDPKLKEMATKGGILSKNIFCDKLSEIMIGLGMQEILSYNLTNKSDLYDKMRLPIPEKEVAEIENAVSQNWSVFRTWLLPSLLEFLSKNKHNEYPQNIFEIGDTILIDKKAETKTKDVRKLSVALTNTVVNYEYLASRLDALFCNIGIEYKLEETDYAPFIAGRVASVNIKDGKKFINIGIIGEIHPQVLNNWQIETPVIAMELNLDELFKLISK